MLPHWLTEGVGLGRRIWFRTNETLNHLETNGGGDVASQADSPNSPVWRGEDRGLWMWRTALRGEKKKNPLDFEREKKKRKKWTGPTGRHDAPSPQSSIRRSWTRSLGSQHAARPEGPLPTRSSTKPASASEEDTVRTVFCVMSDFVGILSASLYQKKKKKEKKKAAGAAQQRRASDAFRL